MQESSSIKQLIEEITAVKKELNLMVITDDLTCQKVLALSIQLDQLIVKYYLLLDKTEE